MSLTESGQSCQIETVTRCLWCKARTANKLPRYKVHGEWTIILSPSRYFGDDVIYTDGICEDCFAIERAKILNQKAGPITKL